MEREVPDYEGKYCIECGGYHLMKPYSVVVRNGVGSYRGTRLRWRWKCLGCGEIEY